MKKFSLVLLSLFMILFATVAIAETAPADYETYGNDSAFLLMRGTRADLTYFIPEVNSLYPKTFHNVELNAFTEQYVCFRSMLETFKGQVLWFYHGEHKLVSLEDFLVYKFTDDSITLIKDDAYYEVDMEKTASTSELVVNPLD